MRALTALGWVASMIAVGAAIVAFAGLFAALDAAPF